MENERVVKSVRNDVNRMTNAEVANQAKSANAAVDQLFAIRTVLEAYGMENLPPALQDFLKLRVAFPTQRSRSWGSARTAPVEVGGLPPRPPHRADGQGGAFSRLTWARRPGGARRSAWCGEKGACGGEGRDWTDDEGEVDHGERKTDRGGGALLEASPCRWRSAPCSPCRTAFRSG